MDYRVVLQGYGGVGKSALAIKFTSNIFVEEYDPTIEDIYRKQVVIDSETCLLSILDTAGEEEPTLAMRDRVNLESQGIIFVFSITCRISFDNIGELYGYVQRVHDSNFPLVLVGNKCDLAKDRVISEEEAQELADTMGAIYLETSAKETINVEECFFTLVRDIRKKSPGQIQPQRRRKR